jgi:hypothetical protein
MLCKWTRTVFSDIESSAAISFTLARRRRELQISRSLGVNLNKTFELFGGLKVFTIEIFILPKVGRL